jgi:PIN domain nuclease of toxin-antitoxin system
MKHLLLDTHVLLWAITNSPELSSPAARLIETTPNLYVSALSIFELKIKEARKKLSLPDDFEALIHEQGIRILDVTPDQLLRYHIYHEANPDPFDNALLTIAETRRFRFLTVDQGILKLQKSYDWIINGA